MAARSAEKIVGMLDFLGVEVHVFAGSDGDWHGELDNCTIHVVEGACDGPAPTTTRHIVEHRLPENASAGTRASQALLLSHVIASVAPSVVHSHEFQHCAYLTLSAKSLSKLFPPWIVSNWGSDIYLFRHDVRHRQKIRAVLQNADAYWAECLRDVDLALAEGFSGMVLPVLPTAGGYDLRVTRALRSGLPTSRRTAIAVKGYQHFAGRAITAIDALDMCHGLLAGREIILYSADRSDVRQAAESLAEHHGAHLTVLDRVTNKEMIRAHGRARVSLGVSISDGISTSFLEALLGGSFPVQSFTACASEWVINGVSGLLVDPLDVRSIAAALGRALEDDDLVDNAMVLNDRTVDARLDRATVCASVVASYIRVANLPARVGGQQS